MIKSRGSTWMRTQRESVESVMASKSRRNRLERRKGRQLLA